MKTALRDRIEKTGLLLLVSLWLASPVLRAGLLETDDLTVNGKALFHGNIEFAPLPCFTNSLLLYYGFSDDSTTVADDSGNGRTGTVYNAAWIPNGKTGGAFHFQGTGDYIDIPSPDAVNNYSISVWFKRNSPTSRGVFYDYSAAGPSRLMVFAIQPGDYVMCFFIHTDVTHSYRYVLCPPTGVYDDTNWHHAVATRVGNTLKIYVDGVDRTVQSAVSGDVSYPIDWSDKIHISYAPVWGNSYSDNLTLDEFRLYTNALSAQDVVALYSNDFSLIEQREWGRISGANLTVSNGIRQINGGATNTFMGKLGIGTDTPTASLDVVGNLKVSGTGEFGAIKGDGAGLRGIAVPNLAFANTYQAERPLVGSADGLNFLWQGAPQGGVQSIVINGATYTGAVHLGTAAQSAADAFATAAQGQKADAALQPDSPFADVTINSLIANGNVGIGTAMPTNALEVVGTMKVTGRTLLLNVPPQGDLGMGIYTNGPPN